MIVCANWISARLSLPALLLIMLLSGPAFAEVVVPPGGEALGADSVRQRVQERTRMQEEYEQMREERRIALAEARESVAVAVSSENKSHGSSTTVRMFGRVGGKSDGSTAKNGTSDDGAADGGDADGGDAGNGFRNIMVGAVILILGTALFLRRRSRGAVPLE